MSKGQLAMAWAKVYPDPEKGGRGRNSFVTKEFSPTGISKARTVLREAPDLADDVLSGELALDQAYETALARRNGALTQEGIDRLIEEAKAAERRAAQEEARRGNHRASLPCGGKQRRRVRRSGYTPIGWASGTSSSFNG
jgi:hypothetical protein